MILNSKGTHQFCVPLLIENSYDLFKTAWICLKLEDQTGKAPQVHPYSIADPNVVSADERVYNKIRGPTTL